MIQLSAVAAGHKSLHHDFRVGANRPLVFHTQLRRNGMLRVKPSRLPHGFIQKQGNDPAMKKARAALVLFSQTEPPHNALPRVILFECQPHAARVGAAAAEAGIFGFWIESHRAPV